RGWHPVRDEGVSTVKMHLKLSGVVKRENNTLIIRNEIYRHIFNRKWVKEHTTTNWPKRLTRGIIVLTLTLLILSVPLGVFAWLSRQEAIKQRNIANIQRDEAQKQSMLAEVA